VVRLLSYVDPVEQRLSLITLGVSDVHRSRRFYEQLGWHGQEVEETVFFQAGCMVLTLWAREKLALDSGIGHVGGSSGGFSGSRSRTTCDPKAR
jgi:uncharacterized protein